jgi:hypothetical protein
MVCLFIFITIYLFINFIAVINMTIKHKNLLNPIMECLYANFVGLHVSVIHMTIIRSVRAKEIVMQQRSPERNGIPLCFTLFSTMDIEL